MKNIIAIGASTSTKSINKQFATYVANKITESQVAVLDLNEFKVPLFNVDIEETDGFPENLTKLNTHLTETDGIVISLAEHNGSYAASFKNIFDWLSRIDRNVWKDKPMMLMATSPGGRGGATVLEFAKSSFPRFGGNIVASFSLPSFFENFSETGIANEELSDELDVQIEFMNDALQ